MTSASLSRFILEKCDGKLTIENKKKKDMIAELVKRGYDSDPVKAWKASQDQDLDDETQVCARLEGG